MSITESSPIRHDHLSDHIMITSMISNLNLHPIKMNQVQSTMITWVITYTNDHFNDLHAMSESSFESSSNPPILQSKARPDTPITPHTVSRTWKSALLALLGRHGWVAWRPTVHLRINLPCPAAVANAATHGAFGPVLKVSCKGLKIPGWWLSPSEKYEFVNWDDDIPNIRKSKIHVPNHQPDTWRYLKIPEATNYGSL